VAARVALRVGSDLTISGPPPSKYGAVASAYLRAAQAYMLISMPTGTSTIFGVFQAISALLPEQHGRLSRQDKDRITPRIAQAGILHGQHSECRGSNQSEQICGAQSKFVSGGAQSEQEQDGQASSLKLALGFGAIEAEGIKRRYLMEETLLRRNRYGVPAVEQQDRLPQLQVPIP
jgi:hypothetical protein